MAKKTKVSASSGSVQYAEGQQNLYDKREAAIKQMSGRFYSLLPLDGSGIAKADSIAGGKPDTSVLGVDHELESFREADLHAYLKGHPGNASADSLKGKK